METQEITVRRIVPNLYSDDLEACKKFYQEFLGMDLVMDLGWILTFAAPENPTAQINVHQNEGAETKDSQSVFLSIEVSDVDGMYERAKKMRYSISYPITDESWGVRRFFVQDPSGATVNLLKHLN